MKVFLRVLLLTTITLLLILAVLSFVFWDTISIFLFPKAVLTEAVSHTITQLTQRFEHDPAMFLLRYLHPEGKQTADLKLTNNHILLGDIQYDMHAQIQPHKFSAEGTVRTNQANMDLNIYMDTDFMAVSSNSLIKGSYYGITYDTFLQDIRKIPLLSWMVGDSVLKDWDSSIQDIQSFMERGYTVPHIPELTKDDVTQLLVALVAAPSQVTKADMIVQGQLLDCYRIYYSVTSPQVLSLVRQYLPVPGSAQTATVSAAFYLYEKTLVCADITITVADANWHIVLELGRDCLTNPLSVKVRDEKGEDTKVIVNTFDRQSTSFHETWDISNSSSGSNHIAYIWNSSTGNMQLTFNTTENIVLRISDTGSALQIESKDWIRLLHGVVDLPLESQTSSASGSILIKQGCSIQTPSFKNLDDWSMADFWALLEGVGALIGFQY
ncbi:MAG: hypothetical protein J6V25_09565 [Oscillospiraceae bacterium]|nr:hypothetical protein [Oscillospiraceae bacterium]